MIIIIIIMLFYHIHNDARLGCEAPGAAGPAPPPKRPDTAAETCIGTG